MKKVALAFVILIAVAIGALLVLPSFWDWNGEKDRIAALVKEHTGRDLEIAGNVSLRLLPTPAFSAREVTLANIEGGSSPAMAQLEELQIRISLLPLMRGKVFVESVTLVKPQVLLEVLPDGRANWDFAAGTPEPSGGAQAPEPTSGATPAASQDEEAVGDESIRVDSFLIEEGTVRYRDARSGRTEMVSGLNADLGAESLLGPFVAIGAAVYQDVPLEFEFSLGRVVDNGATAISISLTLPRAEASGQFVGALSRHEDLQTLRGRLQAKGEDLAGLIRGLPFAGAPAEAPAQLARPFSVQAEVTASETDMQAEAVALAFGELSLDGELEASFGDVPDITATLSTKTIDLDAFLAQPAEVPQGLPSGDGGQVTPSDAPPMRTEAAPPAEGAAAQRLPEGVAVSLNLAADALLYRGQTVRQVLVAARLEDGRLNLREAKAQLPGSSDVSLSGTLTSQEQGPRFSGDLEADSDNLRGLLQWLGVDIAAIPADRLRRMSLMTGIEADEKRVTLRNTDLRLDVSHLTGGVAVALRERPGLGIGFTLDSVNLDAYLPPEVSAPPPTTAPAVPGAPPAVGSPAPSAAPPAAAPAGLSLLGRFDANIDVEIGQLTYRGLPLNGLRLNATLQRGGLVVREMSIADLTGSRAHFTGSLANVDREPSIDGSLDVSVSALSRVAKVLGLGSTRQLPLESFSLTGAINGNREELRFDQRLTALGGTLHAAGKAELRPASLGVDAAVELDHPNLSVLLSELLRDPSVATGLGSVALKAQLTAAPTAFRLSDLQGQVARVEVLAGEVAVNLAGERPRVVADLSTGELPLLALAAPAAAGKSGTGKASEAPAARKTPAAKGRGRWSSKSIDLSGLRAVDAEVKLRSKAILVDTTRLANADLEAVLNGGVLDLKRFDSQAYGGALSVTGRADARETALGGLEVAAAITASEVELKDLLRDLTDSDRFSGPLSFESNLSTQGNSEAALIAGLNGSGKVDGTVTVATKVEEQAGALVLEILGKKVKEIRGVTDSTSVLFGAFAGAPSKIDGTFIVEQGILRSDDLTVRGRDAVALTGGNVDLPAWRLESRTDVFRDEDPKTPYLTATLRGPLDKPDVGIKGQAFQRREEPASVESPAAEEEDKTQQPDAKPQDPEDLLKEGLKGLLKGLGG